MKEVLAPLRVYRGTVIRTHTGEGLVLVQHGKAHTSLTSAMMEAYDVGDTGRGTNCAWIAREDQPASIPNDTWLPRVTG